MAKRTCLMDGMWSNVDIDLCISEIVLNIATMVKGLEQYAYNEFVFTE